MTLLGVVVFVGFRLLWPCAASESILDARAAFDPYNDHFLGDIGTFQDRSRARGACSRWPHAATIVLGGTGIGATFHAVGHVIDTISVAPGLGHPDVLAAGHHPARVGRVVTTNG